MEFQAFRTDDLVRYTGSKFDKLRKNETYGRVVNRVVGEKAYVVEYGNEAYILSEDNLSKFVFSDKTKGSFTEVVYKNALRKWEDNAEDT